MFTFRDFLHLPELDPYLRQIADTRQGIILLAGLPASASTTPDQEIPAQTSAGSIFFPVLIEELLQRHPSARSVLITRQASLTRLPRHLKPRVDVWKITSPEAYSESISAGLKSHPDYLIVDQACEHTLPAMIEAAWQGIGVLAQYASPLWGTQVLQQIDEDGFQLSGSGIPTWVLTIQRLAQLCQNCKVPATLDESVYSALASRYSALLNEDDHAIDNIRQIKFYAAGSCTRCQGKGRVGNIHLFDVYRQDRGNNERSDNPSLFPIHHYAFRLAQNGYLPVDDLLNLETGQLLHTSRLIAQNQQVLENLGQSLERKNAELEATNRVLVKRTEELVALQDIGQALATSQDLEDLATRVCRKARNLSSADRVVLYFGKSTPDSFDYQEATVLACSGLDPSLLYRSVPASAVQLSSPAGKPISYLEFPPGLEQLPAAKRPSRDALAGLAFPLVTNEHQVGLMIVQSVQKKRFAPREVSLLEMLANQAVLALQREGLIQALRDKIGQLQAAQAEIIQKERLERELELARQVQQSVIPKTFPEIPGFHFAARNEPARQVGGDFYDVIKLDDGHFGIAIADVTDKGMPAALYMALTRSLLLAEARRSLSPRQVLANINRLLLELGEPSNFVTVFYGVIDTQQQKLSYARAGHDLPLLLRDGKIQPLGGEGPFLGVLDDDEFQISEEILSMKEGDRLIMYTDGLTDLLNAGGEAFSSERFSDLLSSIGRRPSDEMCTQVFKALKAYQGQADQFDDMTLLIVEM